MYNHNFIKNKINNKKYYKFKREKWRKIKEKLTSKKFFKKYLKKFKKSVDFIKLLC